MLGSGLLGFERLNGFSVCACVPLLLGDMAASRGTPLIAGLPCAPRASHLACVRVCLFCLGDGAASRGTPLIAGLPCAGRASHLACVRVCQT